MNVQSLPRENSPAPGSGRKVLLVDDNPLQLKLVKLQLENAGFVVCAARGAGDALCLVDYGARPDAIVSDVVMDDVDGFELCHALRRRPELAGVPIILLSSAFDEDADVELARRVGADALVARSQTQELCIEALTRSLAADTHPVSGTISEMPTLHVGRVVHQLARMSKRQAAVEARFELLFASAHDAVSVISAEGVVLDANRRWEQITGLTREEMKGKRIESFVIPDDQDSTTDLFAEVLAKGGGRTAPVPIKAAGGDVLYLEFSASTTLIDGEVIVLAVGRDVSALLEAQRKLEASEKHYRSLVEHAPDVIWTATKDWTYTYFSPNVEKLTGFTSDELISGEGTRPARLHPDDLERVRAAREATSTTGVPMDVECRWQHRDGRWLWFHLRAFVRPDGIDGIFVDITARKRLEEQLRQSQKLEAMGQLTAGVAHDFNNLLAIVSANASFLMETLPKDADEWQAAVDVADAAERAEKVTRQLLAFSRRSPSVPCDLDWREVVNGLSRMIGHAVGREVEVTTTHALDLGRVHADASQLGQVVMNLVVNARDAMKAKGKLHIATSDVLRDGTEEAKWGAVPPGYYVRLSVTDDGCGMDQATVDRIFEPFFTTKPEGSGTGLGLSTCYGIVRHAGGTICVETEPGRGTTFHVDLPRVPDEV